jgi:hypothetical protein
MPSVFAKKTLRLTQLHGDFSLGLQFSTILLQVKMERLSWIHDETNILKLRIVIFFSE